MKASGYEMQGLKRAFQAVRVIFALRFARERLATMPAALRDDVASADASRLAANSAQNGGASGA